MAQLQRMDARLDTLSTELYQVNICVGRIARQQATMGGFTPVPTPSPPPSVAYDFDAEDDDDDDDGDDDDASDGDDDDASDDDRDASFIDKMST